MSIYVTGDTHARFQRFNNDFYKDNVKKEDYVIIAGDAGIFFTEGPMHQAKIDFISELPFTLLWVDGNHENHDWIDRLEVSTWNNGKVHQITDNCYHLMRGQIFDIEGHSFFTMGGADSIDKEWRIEGRSWWRQELPSVQEENEALDNLLKHDNKVDYIITHAAPDNILYRINPRFKQDSITHFLYEVEKTVEFKHWYFGHYHEDREIDDKHTLLSLETVKICD
jgi:predicted phosphohydrolase